MVDVLGWASAALVTLGFVLNSVNFRIPAFITWIIGDICWVVYDVLIDNIPHIALSGVIIFINVYGMYLYFSKEKKEYNFIEKLKRSNTNVGGW